ncbi:MAG: tetratricopeptide repeat protein [Chloroflexi bacterium]|nr:tetratricopeptide repeat protein [Chloroflexota bacterium]
MARSWIALAQALELGPGRYDEAEQAYRRALEIAEHGLDHRQLAEAVHQLGQFYRNRGRYAESEPLMRRQVALYEREYEPWPGRLHTALIEYAQVLEKLGDNTEAEAVYRRLFAVLEQRRAASDDDMSLGTTELRITQLSAM